MHILTSWIRQIYDRTRRSPVSVSKTVLFCRTDELELNTWRSSSWRGTKLSRTSVACALTTKETLTRLDNTEKGSPNTLSLKFNLNDKMILLTAFGILVVCEIETLCNLGSSIINGIASPSDVVPSFPSDILIPLDWISWSINRVPHMFGVNMLTSQPAPPGRIEIIGSGGDRKLLSPLITVTRPVEIEKVSLKPLPPAPRA